MSGSLLQENCLENKNSNYSCQSERDISGKFFDQKDQNRDFFSNFEVKNLYADLPARQIESIKTFGKDISPKKDAGLLKAVLREGTGDSKPLLGDTAYVRYHGWKEDGRQLQDQHGEYSFVVGKAEVILAWEFTVASMTEGEVAVVVCAEHFAHGSQGLSPHIPPNSSLIFHLQLISWHGTDISDAADGSLYKSMLQKGELYGGPNEGALCTVEIVGRCQGREFERREVSFEYGEGGKEGVVEGVEMALGTFSRNEKARLKVKSCLAYGEFGCLVHRISPHCDLEYDVHLKDCRRMKDFWDMSIQEKVQQAQKDKLKGMEYFKTGHLKQACKFFSRVVEYLQFISHEGDDEALKKYLLTSSLVDLAICQLKMDDPFGADKSCSRALDVEPGLLKGLYNRAQANIRMKNFACAVNDLRRLMDAGADNTTVRRRLKEALDGARRSKEEERRRLLGMFDK